VFSVLFSEGAGQVEPSSDAVSFVKYGEKVYTQIRRFVIVSVRKEFVFAWLVPTLRCCTSFIDIFSPIFTYSKRGTTKPGVNPRQHAIIYMSDTSPETVPGESLSSMKDPIKVIPANPNERLDRASRIRFGLHHPIQFNMKVKDIGIVAPDDIPKVILYWRMEIDKEYVDIDKSNAPTNAPMNAPSSERQQSSQPEIIAEDLIVNIAPCLATLQSPRYSGQAGFEPIRNPKGFFKKGRVFTMSQSKGGQDAEKTLVVVRPKGQSADCLPITSSGHDDAESERSDHVEIIPVQEGEELPTDDYQSKARVFVVFEAKGTPLAPFSRIVFGETHEVAFDGNLVVRNVGRVVPLSIWHLKQYQEQFKSSGKAL
jgi:hypothetical protein